MKQNSVVLAPFISARFSVAAHLAASFEGSKGSKSPNGLVTSAVIANNKLFNFINESGLNFNLSNISEYLKPEQEKVLKSLIVEQLSYLTNLAHVLGLLSDDYALINLAVAKAQGASDAVNTEGETIQ